MALRNRQGGKVEVWINTNKVDGAAKNIIEFDELALKTDIATATTKSALLTVLGIPTYADQTAANTALPAGDVYYNTATGKVASATA